MNTKGKRNMSGLSPLTSNITGKRTVKQTANVSGAPSSCNPPGSEYNEAPAYADTDVPEEV